MRSSDPPEREADTAQAMKPLRRLGMLCGCTLGVLLPLGWIGLVAISWGVFRKPLSEVEASAPASGADGERWRITPSGLVRFRDAHGVFHYGLEFWIPENMPQAAVEKRCSLKTNTTHGTVERWTMMEAGPGGSKGRRRTILLIPRRWLTLNGFLSPTVILWPRRPVDVLNTEELLKVFWLEPADRSRGGQGGNGIDGVFGANRGA